MRLGLCSRSSDVIEPMIKPQWYVNCSMIGKEALDVAITDENKKLEFIPKQYTAEWRRFLSFIITLGLSVTPSIIILTAKLYG